MPLWLPFIYIGAYVSDRASRHLYWTCDNKTLVCNTRTQTQHTIQTDSKQYRNAPSPQRAAVNVCCARLNPFEFKVLFRRPTTPIYRFLLLLFLLITSEWKTFQRRREGNLRARSEQKANSSPCFFFDYRNYLDYKQWDWRNLMNEKYLIFTSSSALLSDVPTNMGL